MLSAESQIIYDILSEITGGSEVYKVVDADEITDKLPADTAYTKVQLSQLIRELKDAEYVDIKYFTLDEYCLRVIKRAAAQPVQSGDAEAVETKEKEVKERLTYGDKKRAVGVRPGLVLFMSFLGGILGSGVVAAITALLLKFII